jgi:hypothetical protein
LIAPIKNFTMKKLLLLFLIPIISFSFTNLKSWTYQNPESVQNISAYDAALAQCDLDRYRYVDHKNVLKFESGLRVELLSANECIAQGIAVKMDRVRNAPPEFDTQPIFRLTDDGKVIEMLTRNKHK